MAPRASHTALLVGTNRTQSRNPSTRNTPKQFGGGGRPPPSNQQTCLTDCAASAQVLTWLALAGNPALSPPPPRASLEKISLSSFELLETLGGWFGWFALPNTKLWGESVHSLGPRAAEMLHLSIYLCCCAALKHAAGHVDSGSATATPPQRHSMQKLGKRTSPQRDTRMPHKATLKCKTQAKAPPVSCTERDGSARCPADPKWR